MSDDKWLSLKQASKITGKSVNALRLLVNRKRFDMVKRIDGNGYSQWMIHHDSLVKTCGHVDDNDNPSTSGRHEVVTTACQVNTITIEHYEQQRERWQKERDELQTGLMMYRWKFEEIEKQVRLLPAPPEVVAAELEKKTAALSMAENIIQQAQVTQQQYEEALEQLRFKFQEEEHAKEAFRIQWELAQAELKRSWWQKLWKR